MSWFDEIDGWVCGLTWVEHDFEAFANVFRGVRSLKLVFTADMTMLLYSYTVVN